MPIIQTYQNEIKKALTSNSTADSFADLSPTTTDPKGSIGSGYIENSNNANLMLIIPFGTDAANEAFDMRVIGVKPNAKHEPSSWYHIPLAELAVTLGAETGTANTLVGASELFADTIAKTYGADGMYVISPEDDTIAHVLVDIEGCEGVILDFDKDTAAAMNALYALL